MSEPVTIFGEPLRPCQRDELGRHRFGPYNYRWQLPLLSAVYQGPLIPDTPPQNLPLKAYAVQGCDCGMVRLLEYPNGRPFWYGAQHEIDDAVAAWQKSGEEAK